jgi:hypothetical protein
MQELPKTLDAFYDRILPEIDNDEDPKLAYLALQWLTFAARPVSLKELAEAVMVRPESEPYLTDKGRFLDYNDLLQILPSGLVSAINVPRGSDDEIFLYSDPDDRGNEGETDHKDSLTCSKGDDVDYHDESVRGSPIFHTDGDGDENQEYSTTSSKKHDDKFYFGGGHTFGNVRIIPMEDIYGGSHKYDTGIIGGTHVGHTLGRDIGEDTVADEAQDGQQGKVQSHEGQDALSKVMVQFAHFSVKEYLTSVRISKSPASSYHMDEVPAQNYLAQVCFAYLLYVGGQKPEFTTKIFKDFALLHYAANCWQYHMQLLEGMEVDPHLRKLSGDFLQYDSDAWRVWVAVGRHDDDYVDGLEDLPIFKRCINIRHSQIHPITWVSALGLCYPLQQLLSQNIDINSIPQTSILGNPLHAAALYGQIDAVQMLLTAGSKKTREGGLFGNALQAASANGHLTVLHLLRQEGVGANAQDGYLGNALQAATAGGHTDLVRWLPQEGADVYAQGGYYGIAL